MDSNKFEYKTPHVAYQNTIMITCSSDSLPKLVELFNKMHELGEMGSSRELVIDWDGDGGDRLDNIVVNGLTLEKWASEWNRLRMIGEEYERMIKRKMDKNNDETK